MGEKELKELLLKRLYMELNMFKDYMLQRPKEEIYESSFKIEVFVNVYEILLEDVGNMDVETVRGLVYWEHSILEALYREWLEYNDSSFDELKAYVGGELEVMARSAGREEGKVE